MKPRIHLGVYAACLILIAWWTWPLIRHPGHFVPDNTDPRLFSWIMISVFRNLVTRPHFLLDGSGFYPYGLSLTFAEPLVTPSLVAGPLFWWTGSPYLAYNLTLLGFWAASGWAMYAVTHRLTRRHEAAAVAALIYTLSPPRIAYAVEFQMEIMFGLPLAVYLVVRYLETQRLRHLAAFLVVFWLQAIAVWYFAVILGLGLAVLALAYALRRWSGWRLATPLAGAVGGAVLVAALLPVARPFFVTRNELALERSAGDALDRSANVLTYVTTDGTWLANLVHIRFPSETTLFPGLLAVGLAGLALAWVRADRGAGAPRGWPERLLSMGIVASLVVAVLTIAGDERLRIGTAWTRLPSATACGVALLGCLLLRDAVAGWRRWRTGLRDRRLTHGEWVLVLGTMGYFAFLLSLGPLVMVGHRDAGEGLYFWLHPYVLPLRAIRGPTRFGLLVLTVVALLAGLGTAWLLERVSGRRRLVTAALLCAVTLDLVAPRPRYQWIETYTRPVDAALRSAPAEGAVLEWPLNDPGVDVDAKLRSLGHRRRVVNGFAGFVLDYHRELSGLLATAVPPFASPEARTALAQIYPLRYLLVRDATRRAAGRPAGQAVADASEGFLRFHGTYGADDLYDVVALPERGRWLTRLAPYDVVTSRPVVLATLRPTRTEAGVDQGVSLTLNGVLVARTALDGPTTLTATLRGPFRRAAPNELRFEIEYHRTAAALGPAHRLGTTGVTVPLDALVRSAGQPYGNAASIRVGVGELAPNSRGYNLVALDRSGATLDQAVFDTFADPGASEALATWVDALPAGTVVLGAVKDEASGRLGAEAVRALGALGVGGDLRGHFRESHAFIGVKGAPAGSAVEALGPRPVEVRVGKPDVEFAAELIAFELRPLAVAGAPR